MLVSADPLVEAASGAAEKTLVDQAEVDLRNVHIDVDPNSNGTRDNDGLPCAKPNRNELLLQQMNLAIPSSMLQMVGS